MNDTKKLTAPFLTDMDSWEIFPGARAAAQKAIEAEEQHEKDIADRCRITKELIEALKEHMSNHNHTDGCCDEVPGIIESLQKLL